jgi:hypothetical protein
VTGEGEVEVRSRGLPQYLIGRRRKGRKEQD